MKCPKCQTESLTWAPAPPGVGSPRVCTVCHGSWVEQSLYQHPVARAFSEERPAAERPTATDHDLKAGLCPHGHGLLEDRYFASFRASSNDGCSPRASAR